jgi:hypothetical protein
MFEIYTYIQYESSKTSSNILSKFSLFIADDPNLKAGIMSLANVLKIPEHEDPLLRLHVSHKQ